MLGSWFIKQLVRAGVISPITDNRRDFIEGNILDLTLGKVHMIRRKRYWDNPFDTSCYDDVSFIGTKERVIQPTKELLWQEDRVACVPGIPYILESVETVRLPENYQALVVPRTSLFRAGGVLNGASVPHGFEGTVKVGFSIPLAGNAIIFERNARFCGLMFFEVFGAGDRYDGLWNMEDVTTEGEIRRAH